MSSSSPGDPSPGSRFPGLGASGGTEASTDADAGSRSAAPREAPAEAEPSSFDFAEDREAEQQRLDALDRYDALDTTPEPVFDEITELAAYLFDAPIAMVSFIDEHRQWFKACIGLERTETTLDASACIYTIQSEGVTVISDTRSDARLADAGPLLDEPGIRFYAGAPLTTSDGHHVGTLCVIDETPRAGTNERQKRHLQRLADLVVDEMELRREVAVRARREEQLNEARRAAEEARREAEGERRAAEQAQQEAEAAREEAEEANAVMTRFFAGIAHDLQTPLTRIRLFADLLKKSLDDGANRYIQKIHASSDRMSSMVESLQDLAQVRSGQIAVSPEPTDAVDVVASACEAAQTDADASGQTLERRLPEAPVRAEIDPDAYRRVVDNLIANALQHTDDGDRIVVDIGTDDGAVRLSVEDTGPGIPPDTLDTLFEPFTRGDSDADGMGLGLAISKDLVEAMDGKITVESTPDVGTRFDVVVPQADPA